MKVLFVIGLVVLSLLASSAFLGFVIMLALGAAHHADASIPAFGYNVCFWFGVIGTFIGGSGAVSTSRS